MVLAVPGVPSLLGTPLPRVLIPYYHRVYEGGDRSLYELGIRRDLFRKQLSDLQRLYRFVPLDEAIEAGISGRVQHRLASLTFDDGYRDNLTVALPVLQELRIPPTIFLVTGLIGRDERLWYDQVKAVCAAAPGPLLRLPREIGGETFPIRDEAARQRAVLMLLDRLKEQDDATRRIAVAQLVDSVEAGARRDDGSDTLLSWEDARAMEAQGVRFGSHTVTHPLLTQIRDRAMLIEELTVSRRTLEENLTHPLPLLAYPGGANSREVRAAAREAGSGT
jgi:peptidoglycan/xylan/chitin deacetylase (PgdA/CDA1 family)